MHTASTRPVNHLHPTSALFWSFSWDVSGALTLCWSSAQEWTESLKPIVKYMGTTCSISLTLYVHLLVWLLLCCLLQDYQCLILTGVSGMYGGNGILASDCLIYWYSKNSASVICFWGFNSNYDEYNSLPWHRGGILHWLVVFSNYGQTKFTPVQRTRMRPMLKPLKNRYEMGFMWCIGCVLTLCTEMNFTPHECILHSYWLDADYFNVMSCHKGEKNMYIKLRFQG